jgi:hypothetical protein
MEQGVWLRQPPIAGIRLPFRFTLEYSLESLPA